MHECVNESANVCAHRVRFCLYTMWVVCFSSREGPGLGVVSGSTAFYASVFLAALPQSSPSFTSHTLPCVRPITTQGHLLLLTYKPVDLEPLRKTDR